MTTPAATFTLPNNSAKFMGKIALFFAMGSGKGPMSLRAEVAEPGGWMKFMKETIGDYYRRGFPLFCFQRPDGEVTPGDHQDWDSTSALLHEHGEIWREFRDALRWAAEHLPEATFLLYYGTHSRAMDAALERRSLAEHFSRMAITIDSTFYMPNVGYMVDQVTAELPHDHPFALFIQMVRSYCLLKGTELFIEPTPSANKSAPWQLRMPSAAHARFRLGRQNRDDIRTPAGASDCGVVQAEWLRTNPTDWSDKMPCPDPLTWLAERICEPNVMPILYENALPAWTEADRATVRHDDLLVKAVHRAHELNLAGPADLIVREPWAERFRAIVATPSPSPA